MKGEAMKEQRMALLGGFAALSFAIAVIAFGSMLDDFRQSLHPVALLGATSMPRALAFNVFAFLLPGALAAWVAMALRTALPNDTRWATRIGARLVLLATLAFALQGLLPLDPDDLEAPATRLHATAWTLWWIAFVPGALLLAAGPRNTGAWRRLASIGVIAALLILVCAASPWQWLPSGVTQRLAYAAWFGWLVACGLTVDALRTANRAAASAAGSSPPARR
jgi:hypothetical membrane protein